MGWLHWGRPLDGWLLWAGPWWAGCTGLVPGRLTVLGFSLEGWLHWAGSCRAGCTGLLPGRLATLLAALLVPVSPNMLKMCSFNSLRHGISVEKQFSCSFKVQVLAVILLNTQLKVQYSFNVVDIFPNTVHKYKSIKYSSKWFHKYKSIKYSNKLHIKYNVHSSISIQSNPYVQVHSIQLHVSPKGATVYIVFWSHVTNFTVNQ